MGLGFGVIGVHVHGGGSEYRHGSFLDWGGGVQFLIPCNKDYSNFMVFWDVYWGYPYVGELPYC